MGAQHRGNGHAALVGHLSQPLKQGTAGVSEKILAGRTMTEAVYPRSEGGCGDLAAPRLPTMIEIVSPSS